MGVTEQRAALVASLRRKGLRDERVLAAIGEVPRHLFVPDELLPEAYEDKPLPIGEDQTVSQPLVVGLMCEAAALRPTDQVLEVGTGCGYAAAVTSRLCAQLDSIERLDSLAAAAAARLASIAPGVRVHVGDGAKGLRERGPYDAILVTAAAAKIPEPLLWQLKPGGRLVMPVGPPASQKLVRVRRTADGFEEEVLTEVRFVPLISGSSR